MSPDIDKCPWGALVETHYSREILCIFSHICIYGNMYFSYGDSHIVEAQWIFMKEWITENQAI